MYYRPVYLKCCELKIVLRIIYKLLVLILRHYNFSINDGYDFISHKKIMSEKLGKTVMQ